MSFDDYQNKKKSFLQKLKLTATEITKIERDTDGQQDNNQWRIYRKLRFTVYYTILEKYVSCDQQYLESML